MPASGQCKKSALFVFGLCPVLAAAATCLCCLGVWTSGVSGLWVLVCLGAWVLGCLEVWVSVWVCWCVAGWLGGWVAVWGWLFVGVAVWV
jgi:hypothetical protein